MNTTDLPRLLLKDQQTISQPPIIEEWFKPTLVEGDEILTGIDWGGVPPLGGYNIGNLKPTASLSLVTHRKDPLFAAWRFGLGRSVAFLSDDRAKWGAQWVGWSGYAKFWAQTVRWTLRPFAPSDFSTQVVMDGSRGHVVVDALDKQDHYVNKLGLTARIASPDMMTTEKATAQEMSLRQTGPGHYEAWFDAPQIGTYLVNVMQNKGGQGPDASTVVGLSTAYSPGIQGHAGEPLPDDPTGASRAGPQRPTPADCVWRRASRRTRSERYDSSASSRGNVFAAVRHRDSPTCRRSLRCGAGDRLGSGQTRRRSRGEGAHGDAGTRTAA